MPETGSIQIEGLRELDRALARMDAGLRKELQAKLRGVAEVAAGAARTIAASKGLEDDRPPPGGGLIDTIKPFATRGSAGFRVTAKRASRGYPGGYAYPRRLEYGGHQFARPAIVATSPYMRRQVIGVLDWLAHEWSSGV